MSTAAGVLTRRQIVARAVRGLGGMAAATAFLPDIAQAASNRVASPAMSTADLDLLVAVTAAVADANRIAADARARAVWRQAFARGYAHHGAPTRASVTAVCARLRHDAPAGSMIASAHPLSTRHALRAALASRAPAERALDARMAAAAAAADVPSDLATWLSEAGQRITERHDELTQQIGGDPTALDARTGVLKHGAHLSVPGALPTLAGINDPGHPAVVRRLVAASAVSLAAAMLFETPTEPEI